MNSFTNLSDQQLISLHMDGNSDALSTLVYRHKDKLFTSIYFLVKDKYLAEDIFQDTFFKVIDTLATGKYSEEGKFLPWAMRIAHNLCVDHFRRVKRTPEIKTCNNRNIFDSISFSEEGADERIMRNQSGDKVTKMINALPEDQREVVVLRHYANMSFKEIAKLTNCSINTALGRMRYALINLRKIMTEKEIAL